MLNKSLVLAFELKWYFANLGCKILEGSLICMFLKTIYYTLYNVDFCKYLYCYDIQEQNSLWSVNLVHSTWRLSWKPYMSSTQIMFWRTPSMRWRCLFGVNSLTSTWHRQYRRIVLCCWEDEPFWNLYLTKFSPYLFVICTFINGRLLSSLYQLC